MHRNPSRARQRPIATIAVSAALFAAMLATSGCVRSPDAGTSPSPVASEAAPRFASDEEALAAAEEAYAAYLAMSDLIAQEGGRDPERIAAFVTEEQLALELQGFALYSAQGWRTQGESGYRDAQLQQYFVSEARETVIFIACSSTQDVDLLDRAGAVVRAGTDSSPVLLQLKMTSDAPDYDLVLAEASPQGGTPQCR